MNAWLQSMGLDGLKLLLSALLLPPVPWLVLILLGTAWRRRRPRTGWALVLLGVALIWACCTHVAADHLGRWLLNPPPALRDPDGLARSAPAKGQTLILVLGGGRNRPAEYADFSLTPISIERLRYGVWLSRRTGYALAFSGGLSPGADVGPTEAAIATRIARDEFRQPLRWAEDHSRDTHENALRSVDLLRALPPAAAVSRLVLVTHEAHMPRALGHFRRARDAADLSLEIVPAPVGITERVAPRSLGDYLPSPDGIARCRYVLREWLALLARA
ncbi:MAG: YdcF family protein [Proteobacteria bacterium]|nr:YdcF family protein [Pseudomonadota bacterium]